MERDSTMFVGFNTHISEPGIFSSFEEHGIGLFNNQKAEVRSDLDSYILNDCYLEAAQIEENWFPSIDADVFISHSHRDQKLAIGLAGWFHEIFGITSFIDSCVWGYVDDLLKKIDERYCVSKRKPNGTVETYDYSRRNQSTAHVHMILNTALQKMIDKTECLMFLNTPNSLLIGDVIDGSATASPWIYSELTFSRLCQKKKLSEYRQELMHGAIHEFAELRVKYDVCLTHLEDLKYNDLYQLWVNSKQKRPHDALDDLYSNLGLFGTGDR